MEKSCLTWLLHMSAQQPYPADVSVLYYKNAFNLLLKPCREAIEGHPLCLFSVLQNFS